MPITFLAGSCSYYLFQFGIYDRDEVLFTIPDKEINKEVWRKQNNN